MSHEDRTYRRINGWFGRIFGLWGYRIDLRGAQHIPSVGPAVIATNHISFLDFTFIGYAARERERYVRFMSKRSIFELRVAGRLMRRMRHIPVDRRSGAVAYRQARRLLDDGEIVGVFPEATISRSWLLKPFRRGAAGLAVSRGVPVVPAIVWGAHRILTVDKHRSLRRRIPVTIRVGEALTPGDDESIDELNERLFIAMAALLDEAIEDYPDEPRDEADRWWLPHDRGGTAPDPVTAHELDVAAVIRLGDALE